jgi:glycogen operon protein
MTGSSDIFERNGRRPRASINFVTAHDGFTLHDLVSYNAKHNEANLEANHDGVDQNYSWNCGVEGPSDDPAIAHLRAQQKRNLMATLLLSQGTPMLLGGDELMHTQLGNNNAYCQDNDIGWISWTDVDEHDVDFLDFVRKLIALRREHPVFRRTRFFHGHVTEREGLKDISWISPDGGEMGNEAWLEGSRRCFGALLGGETGDRFVSLSGYPEYDDTFLILMNANDEDMHFILPTAGSCSAWELVFDTTRPVAPQAGTRVAPGEPYVMRGRTVALLVGR